MVPKIANSPTCRAFAVTLSVALASAPVPALAQTATDAERAQSLFDEGRALMKAGDFAQACEKLAQSQTLDPGGGTLLNLGICRAREGRTATAYRLLSDALTRARADGRADRIATAERHLAELTPRLSRLAIRWSPEGPPADASISLDGTALAPELVAQPVPLDPGEHELTVMRPGYRDFSRRVTLGPEADRVEVEVPALEPLPAAEPVVVAAAAPVRPTQQPAPPAAPAPRDEHGSRTLGWALVGGGAAALAVGTYFGARALSLKTESDRYYDGNHCTQQSCVDDYNHAQTAALASDVALGIGLVAAGAGVYFLLAPGKAHGSERATAKPARAARGLAVELSAGPSSAFAAASTEF
jgi:tetratricopeptide (TPR) repeat protein